MTNVTSAHDVFIIGLKNAHAMENQALSIMKPQLSRIEHYPEVAAQLDLHIRETDNQMQRLEQILAEVDESHSSLKDAALSFTGSMAALTHSMASDEILKNSYANYAFEHFEIAAYISLITAAEESGATQATALLRQNLDEERRMAGWIEENLPAVTRAYIGLSASGERADV
ncbi:ferritin-like domain-containing protein (plasmid) [Paracoccus marcusii]|uniref:ferritin-like domain-containing protein n=1 Tax=Paracoccus TaxID=265 RepID=UPI001891C5E7|nr:MULTISPECIES: ferritin-like domain-containing protein [Paracoccus]MBF5080066.1 ferritin-like domain-containing protein [Paracoccus sp. NBH48]QXI65853.1 Protein YciE [Paracoccus marcusii]